jgi:hypothetical protein
VGLIELDVMVDSCQDITQPSGSTKGEVYLDQMRNFNNFKREVAFQDRPCMMQLFVTSL